MVIVAANEPLLLSGTVPLVSRLDAMFVVPHGFAVDGRCTSLRTGVPLTPSIGEIAACACACSAPASKSAAVAMTGFEKNMMKKSRVEARKTWSAKKAASN